MVVEKQFSPEFDGSGVGIGFSTGGEATSFFFISEGTNLFFILLNDKSVLNSSNGIILSLPSL